MASAVLNIMMSSLSELGRWEECSAAGCRSQCSPSELSAHGTIRPPFHANAAHLTAQPVIDQHPPRQPVPAPVIMLDRLQRHHRPDDTGQCAPITPVSAQVAAIPGAGRLGKTQAMQGAPEAGS
jgi:hypothetical protein